MKKVILLILILTLSCNKKKDNNNKKQNIERVEITKQSEKREIKYITAKSGLIYRDEPKGKQLGKLKFNEKIVITEHTNIFQEIKDGNKTIKAEWLATKIDNENVYIFGGFLSDTKTKITLEDLKQFMGTNIWVSQDFKNILEETKSYKEAFYYGFSLQLKFNDNGRFPILEGYLLNAQDDIIYSVESLLNNKELKLMEINYKTLTIRYKNKNYTFFNNNNKGADAIFEQWFKGNYSFKNENGTKNYTSKEISYTSELQTDFMYLNNKIYRVDEIKKNTYYLSEIKFTESEKEDEKWELGGDFNYDIVYITPTGKKATLKKI